MSGIRSNLKDSFQNSLRDMTADMLHTTIGSNTELGLKTCHFISKYSDMIELPPFRNMN